MKPEWRPDDWVNPFESYICNTYLRPEHDAFERGASAMLSALLKWMDEKCDKHPIPDDFVKGHQGFPRNLIKWNGFAWIYSHRKDCPQCFSELKEQNK